MKQENISGRVAIVTGGSSGIGKSICELLGKAGVRVVVVGRDELRCNEVADGIVSKGGQALPVVADIIDPVDMPAMRLLAIWSGQRYPVQPHNRLTQPLLCH